MSKSVARPGWLSEGATLSKAEARLLSVIDTIFKQGLVSEAQAALSGLYNRATTKRSKGGGSRSKAKGRAFMLHVADLITKYLGLEEGDVYTKATSQIGCDLHLSPRAARAFPYSVEGKKVESLNIWAALLQAASNAEPGRPAVVFFSRAHAPTYVALEAEVFLELVRAAQADAKAGAQRLRG